MLEVVVYLWIIGIIFMTVPTAIYMYELDVKFILLFIKGDKDNIKTRRIPLRLFYSISFASYLLALIFIFC